MEDSKTHLILRSFEKDLSKKELAELMAWRKVNSENEQQYQETKFLWEKAQMTKANAEVSVNKKAALEKVKAQINNSKVVPLSRRLMKWAAAILFLVGSGIAFQMFNGQAELVNISTAANEQREVVLPDLSKVWMNENSSLSYVPQFDGENRSVQMEGDVVFEVTPNPSKPFVVQSSDHEVTVLGTKFNVLAPKKKTDTNSEFKVHVFHGKVKVKSDDSALILTKGMTAGYEQNKLSLIEDYFPNSHFKHTEILVFKNQSLQTVLDEIETAYEVNIDLAEESLMSCNFTGKFKSQNIDEVMDIIAEVLKLEFIKIDATNFKITGGSCN